MQLGKLEGIVPNRRACFDLLCLLENEYNCSIKLWLDANNPRGGEIGWTIYCAGSGTIWDSTELDCFVGSARVLDADGGNLYSAIWAALRQLESRFRKVVHMSIIGADDVNKHFGFRETEPEDQLN